MFFSNIKSTHSFIALLSIIISKTFRLKLKLFLTNFST